MYTYGYGGAKRDDVKAVKYYTKSCNISVKFLASSRGIVDEYNRASYDGCVSLGEMCLEGKGVKQDDVKAAKYFTKSCNGAGAGCIELGKMYEHSIGVKQSYPKAKEFYKKACEGGMDGDPESCEDYVRLNKR